MNNNIKEIAEKFLTEEKIPTKAAILMASLGLNKSAGDIADIAYGINFNQHPYNEERQQQMIEYLGYAMLNWEILALSTGISADEIAKRFSAEWLTKRTGKASIKDLLKHLKPNALGIETPTTHSIEKPISSLIRPTTREPLKSDFTKQF
jgi:hypothetical protein